MKLKKQLLALGLAALIILTGAACGTPAAPEASQPEQSSSQSVQSAPESSSSSAEENSASESQDQTSEAESSEADAQASAGESTSSQAAAESASPAEGDASSSQASSSGTSAPESSGGDIPDFMLPGAAGAASGEGGGSGSGSGSITVSILVECSEAEGYDIPCDINILDTTLTLKGGSTVYDALKTAAKEAGVAVAGSGSYIKGIAGLYEKDCDGQGGWTYTVNGDFPSVGCNSYKLSDGDSIQWSYVVDTGTW